MQLLPRKYWNTLCGNAVAVVNKIMPLSVLGVLRTLVEAATAEASILSLCEKGDALIMEETNKIFKKEKEMKKGQ